MVHDFLPKPDDVMWTPADWAWIGGLINALFAFWYHGIPLVGHRARKFEPQAAMQMMADLSVRNVFLPPTALKLMRQAGVKHSGVKLRSIFTGGESLGGELLGWVRETFGIDAHVCLNIQSAHHRLPSLQASGRKSHRRMKISNRGHCRLIPEGSPGVAVAFPLRRACT